MKNIILKKVFIILQLFTTLLFSNELSLSKEENDFLKEKKSITMCIDPNWMPFEKYKNGKHIGISADYFKIIQEKIKIPIQIIPANTWSKSLGLAKNKRCDILSLIMKTPERLKYFEFTKPYLTIPLVLATRINEAFVNELKYLSDKKIGIIKNYAYSELLKKRYPHIHFEDVENIQDGLEKVSDNEIYGFVGSLSTIGYHIQKDYFGQLKIGGKFDDKWSLSIGIRNDMPLLTSIFNKAIDLITEEEHQIITNKWLSVKYINVSYKYIFEIIAIAFLIIIIILFINRKLSQEINKRKEIENYLSIIIKGAKLGTWLWEPKTNKNTINSTWAEMIGYTKEEVDEIGDFFKFVHEDDIKKIKLALENHKSGIADSYKTEFRMKTKDGKIKWIYSCGSIVEKDSEKNPILIAGIHQDITQNRQLEEEVENKNKFIMQQSRQAAMGEMLENIAHQWRQPLSVITTSASGIKLKNEFKNLSNNELIDSMDQIMKSGNYLSQTIEDFRGFFSKEKILSEISITTLIEKSLQFLKSKIINRNIQIISNIYDDTIYSYENELVQALINIFANAVDALENSHTERYIFIEESSDKYYMTISIKDTAGGIDEKILFKIFDPYFTTKHKSQGTGIGLHMSREIIEKHLKGSIEASNKTFKYKNKLYTGAIFTIKIPKI